MMALCDEPQTLPDIYGKKLTFKTGGADSCDCAEPLALIEQGKIDPPSYPPVQVKRDRKGWMGLLLHLEVFAMNHIDIFINQFIQSTIANQQARLSCDTKTANQHFADADRCICEIKQFPDWITSVLPLLKHENIDVRIRSASILLPYAPIRAQLTLLKCKSAPGEEGFEAQMVLKEWNSGNLKFPEFENGMVVYKTPAKITRNQGG